MKRSLLIVLLFLSAYSFGAETGFGQLSLSCSAVTTTGACTAFNVHPPDFVHVPQANSFTWQTIFSGGTATSITIRLEGSIDGTSFSTIDASTSTAGETRTKTTAAYNYFRCNVAAYSPNGTNVSCQITPQFVQGGGASAVDSVNGQTGTVVLAATDVGAAPLASPAFTGTPTAPTQTPRTNTTRIATTAYADETMGMAVNSQTAATYTIATSDWHKLLRISNASAVAVTLPQAGASFPSGWWTTIKNIGAGLVTITPTTSTINGLASITLPANSVRIVSDGTNYFTADFSGNSQFAAHTFYGNNGASSATPSNVAINEADVTSLVSDLAAKGTVSSVAQTVPSGLSISGSPVTGSGTLAITWTSAADQIVLSTASNTAGFAAVPSCSAGTSALTYNTTTHAFGCNSISAGTGTVTSVGHTVNGGSSSGIFAITGSPVTTSGTLDLALTLTSGGVPYASSTSVLSSSALLTSNSPVMGGGAGAAPKTLTFLTTNGTNELDIGVAGGGNGVLGLKGNTSGTATITAPAVAGTVTNPIGFSNGIAVLGGSCSAPTYTFNGDLTSGFCDNSTGVLIFKANNSNVFSIENTGNWFYSGQIVGFKSSGFSNDTSISRSGAGIVQIGTSSANASGRLNVATVSTGTATWTSGTGSPESVVTAPIGSLFTRTDGGASTTLYVKESGAGNTGWIAK